MGIRSFVLAAVLAAGRLPASGDEYLTSLYDRLHDSPLQQKLRRIAPVPFGVVFLPWPGMTEQDLRHHFQLMKKLGFCCLKQTMPNEEWSNERMMRIAFEEGIIPFWYGEGGWEPITEALLARLGISPDLPMAQIRRHPAMLKHQQEVLRRGIEAAAGSPVLRGRAADDYRHTPDPILRPADLANFRKWLRETYKGPQDIARAWNEHEIGISGTPIRTWEDVDRAAGQMAHQANDLRGYGGEYGRVRDVLRYKADFLTRSIATALDAAPRPNPFAPTRTGGEMGLFLPFAYRATKMEDLAETQTSRGSFYPSIHLAWHYGEVNYEVARTVYMQASFATDLFKGGWAGTWESTGGPQQLTGGKGWDRQEAETTPGFTVDAGTITQMFLSYLAGGLKGAGVWTWNFRPAGWEAGEFALLNRQLEPSPRAIAAGRIAQAAERYRDELWQAHKEPYVGVLVNWDSDAMWAAISLRGRDHFRHYPMQARVGVSRALINGNIPWEYVTPRDLEKGLGPRYRAIYLPAQIALSSNLLSLLTAYVQQGGRLVIDSPGAMYDESGHVLDTGLRSAFEQLFGAAIADFQYSNNVPQSFEGIRLDGFISDLKSTTATVRARFQSGAAAVTERKLGKGSAVVLAWDASFASFRPGREKNEGWLRRYLLGGYVPAYGCSGAIVYRIASPGADHYFLINDGPAKRVRLDTAGYRYKSLSDAVTGQSLSGPAVIQLDAYSGRWLRFQK